MVRISVDVRESHGRGSARASPSHEIAGERSQAEEEGNDSTEKWRGSVFDA